MMWYYGAGWTWLWMSGMMVLFWGTSSCWPSGRFAPGGTTNGSVGTSARLVVAARIVYVSNHKRRGGGDGS